MDIKAASYRMRSLPAMPPVTNGNAKSDPPTRYNAVSVPVPRQNRVPGEPIDEKAANISRRLKVFLRSLGMTVYQISQLTARPPFGKGTRAYIRDALYAEIESGQMPDINQLAALAKLTGYRLVDWLTLFGYHVDDILRLQLELHTEHTILLPGTIYDSLVLTPWIRQFDAEADLGRTQSLVTLIDGLGHAPLGTLDHLNRRRFLYARVGRRDDMMRPRIIAGSIVRVDPTRTTVQPRTRSMYLVQHHGGLSCCYVEQQDDQHLILLPDEISPRVMRCRTGTEATILGAIDLELRQFQETWPNLSKPARVERHNGHAKLSDPMTKRIDGAGVYARVMRERIGVSFREAQNMTHQIAKYFDDPRYKIALGSLSDAETCDQLPRHISKIFSLCIAYSMDLWEYLRAGGLQVDELNGAPIPRPFLHDEDATAHSAHLTPIVLGPDQNQATESVIQRLGEVPFFLLQSLESIIRQEQLSLDDVYIWGRRDLVLHPLLKGALLLLVNRRQRRVPDSRAHLSLVERPLFLIRTPDKRYLAGMCAVDGGTVLVQPHSRSLMPVLTYPARDVVVIGRISAVLRATDRNL